MSQELRTPRGTKDILPEDQKYWRFLEKVVSEKSEGFGCGKIETPLFEYAEIFQKSMGVSSDVVSKEMFEVRRASNIEVDLEKNDSKLMILRPEYTAGIARAYIENGMKTWPQPVKLYYQGPVFRYDRPQQGRYRQFNQFGVEIFGDAEPLTDSAVIFLAVQILRKLGLGDNIIVDVNSIGDKNCRPKMKKKLTEYFEKFLPSLCPDCNKRYLTNPLRILDCKEEKCQKIAAGAPQLVDMLCTDCKKHFKEVLEILDSLEVSYNLNPKLVRGLDYYTRTVFEIYDANDTQRQSTLLAGGRYDDLIKLFGDTDTPAVGFAGGSERIIEKIKEKEIAIPEETKAEVCIAQIGEKAQKKCLSMVAELENAGFKAACILGKESLKSQLRMASKMNAKICVIIGQREILDKSALVRNMDDGTQESVKLDNLINTLRIKLGK